MSDQELLTEVERQKKYLDELPKDFSFPLFNTRRALESQRQTGYKNTAVAAREIVDNAIEAKSTRVHVAFRTARAGNRTSVSAMAFIDDGSGMLPKMVRYALSWGGGTHFDDPSFIGRFGFGLPNASINQTRSVEVYSKTAGDSEITKAFLRLDDYGSYERQSVPETTKAELPRFVEEHLSKCGWDFEHGTVVVWLDPDRLTYKDPKNLEAHLLDDFGVAYRYLLDQTEIRVNGTAVEVVDPLFLNPRGRYFLAESEGGAQSLLAPPLTLRVRQHRDPATGALMLSKVVSGEPGDIAGEAIGTIVLRAARFPYGFVAGGKGGKGLPEEAKKRFEIRKLRRGISFVRAGREIETSDLFPRSVQDARAGLGKWPLLQGYAYHWGIEVSFDPSLDDAFGVANDKQRVRPIDAFWRLLVEERIDDLARHENDHQQAVRKGAKERRMRAEAERTSTPTPAEVAFSAVPSVTGKKVKIPDRDVPAARKSLEEASQRRAKAEGLPIEQARTAVEQEQRQRQFKVEYYEQAAGPFYEPEWVGIQIVVKINKAHPFFTNHYAGLKESAPDAREALDVLLLTLGRAELETTDEMARDWFKYQRVSVWSKYLEVALPQLERLAREEEEEEDEEVTAV